MTGRQRVQLALLLLAVNFVTGEVVSALVPYAFACPDGGEPGCCLTAVEAIKFVLGFFTGSAFTFCFLWFAFYDEFFGAIAAAMKAGRGDAEPDLGGGGKH